MRPDPSWEREQREAQRRAQEEADYRAQDAARRGIESAMPTALSQRAAPPTPQLPRGNLLAQPQEGGGDQGTPVGEADRCPPDCDWGDRIKAFPWTWFIPPLPWWTGPIIDLVLPTPWNSLVDWDEHLEYMDRPDGPNCWLCPDLCMTPTPLFFDVPDPYDDNAAWATWCEYDPELCQSGGP